MPINPPVSIIPNTYTLFDIILDAMIEIGILAPGEEANAEPNLVQWLFRKANYLLDEWAAEENYVYSVGFQVFSLTPNLSPHSIGPNNATFAATQRPVRIEGATLLLPGANGQNVETPIDIVDDDWWQDQPVKSLAGPVPTALYYSPDNPNGNCYFWTVPTIAYQVRLRLWSLLSQFTAVTDPIDGPGGNGILPPAYRTAIMLTLAETAQSGAGKGKELDASLAERAKRARAAIFGNNMEAPRISTIDSGMPTIGGHTRYNFLTREPWK